MVMVKASPYLSSVISAAPPQRSQAIASSTPAEANDVKKSGKSASSTSKSRKRAKSETTSAEFSAPAKKKQKSATSKAKDAAPKSAKKHKAPLPIPKTYEEATKADRMLFDDKTNGVELDVIRPRFNDMTGRLLSRANLSLRYVKLKASFEGPKLSDKERKRILDAQTDVVKRFETSGKWDQIATAVAQKGGKTYTGKAIRKLIGEIENKKSNKALRDGIETGADHNSETGTATTKDLNEVGELSCFDETVNPSDLFSTDEMVEEMGSVLDHPTGSVGDEEDAEGEEDDMIHPLDVV